MLPSALVAVACSGDTRIGGGPITATQQAGSPPRQLNRNEVSGADCLGTGIRRNRRRSPAVQHEAVLVDAVLPDAVRPETVQGIAIPGGACMRRGDHDQSDSSNGKKRSHCFSPFRLVFTVGDWDLMRQPR